jgi:hypothetical protein
MVTELFSELNPTILHPSTLFQISPDKLAQVNWVLSVPSGTVIVTKALSFPKIEIFSDSVLVSIPSEVTSPLLNKFISTKFMGSEATIHWQISITDSDPKSGSYNFVPLPVSNSVPATSEADFFENDSVSVVTGSSSGS